MLQLPQGSDHSRYARFKGAGAVLAGGVDAAADVEAVTLSLVRRPLTFRWALSGRTHAGRVAGTKVQSD